jgi:AcrR family transcriptional regulator
MATASVTTDSAATKSRLIDVAERLFADHGFDAVSLRQITSEAEANLAAVNYHFGSKEELTMAVVKRWLTPLNVARLQLLAEAEKRANAAGRSSPVVAEVAEAFVRPALELYRDSEQSRQVFFRLIGRCMLDSRQSVSVSLVAEFREVVEKFGAAFGRCLPHLTSAEVTMRMMFMAGAMVHTILNIDKLAVFHGSALVVPPTEELVRQMVEFVASGFTGEKGRE